MKRLFPTILILAIAAASAGALLAQIPDANNIPNWPAPATWTPERASGGIHTMTDVGVSHPFQAITPCRIADTRAGQGFAGQAGPPALTANVTRSFQITGVVAGVPAQCEIPSGAEAVSFQFSVGLPTSAGNFIAWPAGAAIPNISVLNWDGPIGFLGNGTVVPLSAGGALSVRLNAAAGQTAHLILDVNGYYGGASFDAGQPFVWSTDNSGSFGAARIRQLNTSAGNAHGLTSLTDSTGGGSSGVLGLATAATGVTWGVQGETMSTTNGAAGVLGNHDSATGEVYGVLGDNDSSTFCSAGVWGRSGANLFCNILGGNVGVLGTNTGIRGVVGITNNASGRGVQGVRADAAGTVVQTLGILGYTGNSGVHSFQDVTAGGLKPFVVPYEGDTAKQIVFVAAEADEALTMTRGRGRFQRGLATIQLPRHFQLVTEPEGLSIQVTPIGDMANVAVVSLDLERGIVLKASRSVEFFYTVHGVRRGYADFAPVQENIHFIPVSPDEKMLPWPKHTKAVLIQNGVYHENGMPNLETARRMGWDKIWKAEEARVLADQAADREARERGLPEGSILPQYATPENQ
jgi:hypothetical protein